MSGETEQHVSAWTPDTLKILHDEKIEAVNQLSKERFRFVLSIGGVLVAMAVKWLFDLNHENARVLAAQQLSVNVSKYEAEQDATLQRLQTLEAKALAAETKGQSAAEETARAAGVRSEQKSDARGGRGDRRQAVAVAIAAAALLVSVLVFAVQARKPTTPATPTPPATVTVTTVPER